MILWTKKRYSVNYFVTGFLSKKDLFLYFQSYYEYDRKSKIRFYLRLFFDLMGLGVQNSHIVHDMISRSNSKPFSIKHLEFRTQLATQLIDGFCSRKVGITSTPRKSVTRSRLGAVPDLAGHYQTRAEVGVRKRCIVCTKNGIENRTNTICFACKKPMCFTRDRNCLKFITTKFDYDLVYMNRL